MSAVWGDGVEEQCGGPVDPVGGVYWVPDRWWGFEPTRTENHPGACVDATADAFMLQGTSVRPPPAHRWRYVRVEPDAVNGLERNVHFALRLRRLPLRRLELLHADPRRRMGQLDPRDLSRLREAMWRVLGRAS